MDYKLELHNFAVDGRVTRIVETNSKDVFCHSMLCFKYFNKKLCLWADVIFEDVNRQGIYFLYKLAVTFVKRLK